MGALSDSPASYIPYSAGETRIAPSHFFSICFFGIFREKFSVVGFPNTLNSSLAFCLLTGPLERKRRSLSRDTPRFGL